MTTRFVRPTRRDARRREDLVAAADDTRDQTRRADTKAGLLLTAASAVVGLVASGPLADADGPAGWLARGGLAALVAAALVLLAAITPRTAAAPFNGSEPRVETPRERLRALSRVVRAKYRLIKAAALAVGAGIVLIGAAAITAGVVA